MVSDIDRIVKVVELNASVSRVWKAVTDHEEFGAWFRVELDGPFVVGQWVKGRVTYPGYEGTEWRALVERMDHGQLFAFSWDPLEVSLDPHDSDAPLTRVEFHLEASGSGTKLTIIESGFDSITDHHRRSKALRLNREGWDIQSQHIAEHVAACNPRHHGTSPRKS